MRMIYQLLGVFLKLDKIEPNYKLKSNLCLLCSVIFPQP